MTRLIRGKPERGEKRLITKSEYALLRKLGIKRTYYISATLDGTILILYRKRENGESTYIVSQRTTPEAIEILHKFWGIKS